MVQLVARHHWVRFLLPAVAEAVELNQAAQLTQMQQQLHEVAVVVQAHKMVKLKPVLPVLADLPAEQFSMLPEMLLVVAQALQQMVLRAAEVQLVLVLPVLQRL
jgi:hypothetical protein